MHIISTGFSNKKVDQKKRFAEIRLVAKEDNGDDPQEPSGNTQSLVNGMEIIIQKFYPDLIQKYHLDRNMYKEKKSGKGDAALRFSIPLHLMDEFLDEDIWSDPSGDWLKWLNNKKFKNSQGQFITDANGNKMSFQIPFNFDAQYIKDQVENGASFDDYYAAEGDMKDYVAELFQKLDQTEVQNFLRNYCGHIKLVNVTGDNGWEYVQLSTKNSLMVFTQYAKKGITPTFVCNPRDWARFFNRKIVSNAIGAVIETPYKNKRLDRNEYNAKTNSDFDQDYSQGGTLGYRASQIGYNQHDTSHEFLPSWVYDVSQTELMTDRNGNPLPDVFNDPTQQRRVTNLGNDTTLAHASQQAPSQAQVSQNISNGTMSPFEENIGKIPQCLENIKEMIQLKRFLNQKTNVSKYATVLPIVEEAEKHPSPQSMRRVIEELANCELYQIENTRARNKKMEYRKIISDCVMLCCGFGTTNDMAQFARSVLSQNKQDAYKVWEHINNIVNIINGSKIMKEDILSEELCKAISFEEFQNLIGLDDMTNQVEQIRVEESIKKVNKQFNDVLNKLKEVKL